MASRVGLPLMTLHRRLKEKGIEPDAIVVPEETGQRALRLYSFERLPELRRALVCTEPEIVN